MFRYNHDSIGLEVMGELSQGANERQSELLQRQISGLGINEGLARIIYWFLYPVLFPDEDRADRMIRDR